MRYSNILCGKFISRPNRFIANIEINGKTEICHVKNTGRCRELLIEGAEVFLEESNNPNRKTKYDLVAVKKGSRMINMDSQAPNKAAEKFIRETLPNIKSIKQEVKYGNSRFDFYAETENEKWFIEIKGVTLEKDGVVLFPDAPTERGVKHIYELCGCMDEGYKCMILFVIQMENVRYFTPNYETHKKFGEALKHAKERGVMIKAVDCTVTPDTMEINNEVEVRL